jgi:hypothetical protein
MEVAAAGRPKSKTCPDCAETVLGAALVCKHCGYRFDESHTRDISQERTAGGENPTTLRLLVLASSAAIPLLMFFPWYGIYASGFKNATQTFNAYDALIIGHWFLLGVAAVGIGFGLNANPRHFTVAADKLGRVASWAGCLALVYVMCRWVTVPASMSGANINAPIFPSLLHAGHEWLTFLLMVFATGIMATTSLELRELFAVANDSRPASPVA